MRAGLVVYALAVILLGGWATTAADTVSFQRITNADSNDPTYINNFIDASRIYTHALDMGPSGSAVLINGVQFTQVTDAMLNGAAAPNLAYSASAGVAQQHPGGAGGGGGVFPPDNVTAGSALGNLLSDFVYNSTVAPAGGWQQYTLSGLNPNTDYLFRLYIRPWEGPSGTTTRRQDITFTVGGTSNTVAINEDRPFSQAPNTNTSDRDAWFLEYQYNTGANTSLSVRMTTQTLGTFATGAYHNYGMTNEVVPEPGTMVMLLSIIGAMAVAMLVGQGSHG
jgi:hypothetical protein